MKRIVLKRRYGHHHESFDASDINRVSVSAEPWHTDRQPAVHPRPTETPMFARRATFGASGPAQTWRKE